MLRSKDFLLMDVLDLTGKKIGFVKDLLIDFHSGKVMGFRICCYSLWRKDISVLKEDIIAYNSQIIIKSFSRDFLLNLKDIINIDIVDSSGTLLGLFEDVIFNEDFVIKGIIVSTGFIRNYLEGKKILLMNKLMLGEHSILFYGKEHIQFATTAHRISREVNCNEV